MKKIFFVGSLILVLFNNQQCFSQIGSSCAAPHIVTPLPFSALALNTSSSGDNYTNADACGSAYMDGNDYVFEFTPLSTMSVNVTLSNTGLGVGLFVIHRCPDDPLATCEAQATSFGGNPSIASVTLMADSTYYIVVSTNNPFGMNQTTAFDISINENIQLDAGITAVYAPVSNCALGSSETIQVTVQNFGVDSISNFDVAYQIDANPPVTETITDTILPGAFFNYSFSLPADFSGIGITYQIKSYTLLSGDALAINDTLSTQITHTNIISSFPYAEDFESSDGYYTAGGSSPSWAWGVPSAPVINFAASGSNAWVTNLTGNSNANEQSYLMFPCLDFSTLSNPSIDFNIWYETSLIGSVYLESSIDGGITWDTIGLPNDPNNWYNGLLGGWNGSSAGWLPASHLLDNCAGQSNVSLRFSFSDFLGSEGVAIDDISIHNCVLPIPAFTYVANGLTVDFTNTSSNALSYEWHFDDGNTSILQSPSHTYTMIGLYNVTLLAFNSCSLDSTTLPVMVTGTEENYESNEIICFPSPSNELLSINFANGLFANSYLKIIDYTGRTVYSENIEKQNQNSNYKINVSDLTNGMYVLMIENENKKMIKRFVVEHEF